MQAQVVLIIDSRKEMSQKYKKIIQQDSYVYPVISHDIKDAFQGMNELEPDLIIVSDNIDENINNLCRRIREESDLYRPVLVVLSKSSYLNDKLEALKSGADDYISEPVDSSEFSMRIFAHLRRHVEELSSTVTNLPFVNMSYKVLKRNLNSGTDWALMYIDIDNFKPYIEIYGYLASDKLLKTFAAILKSAIDKGDFLGHIKEDSFIILTSPSKADQIAAYLNYAFDAVSPKFYTAQDAKRGYIILFGDEKAGMRVPLVSISIGIVSNIYRTFNNYQEAINAVMNVHKLAKSQPGSSWISDRPRISTEDGIINSKNIQKKILILETDAALAYLLTTTLEMQGYTTETISNPDETLSLLEKIMPDLVLIDANEKNLENVLEICRMIKNQEKTSCIKVIISTIVHDKEKILDAGADLYLPKPYELMALFGWISRFLNFEYD